MPTPRLLFCTIIVSGASDWMTPYHDCMPPLLRAEDFETEMMHAFYDRVAKYDDAVLLVGRLLHAGLFVHESIVLTTNFDAAPASMAKMGVPAPLLVATIALQLSAGMAIAVGWQTRLGATALGLFCVMTAVLFHTNFGNRDELLHFEKDLAIAGGMFVLMVHGAGAWSLDNLLRARRFAAAPA